MNRLLLSFMLVFVFCSFAFAVSDDAEIEKIKKAAEPVAENILDALKAGDYQRAVRDFSPAMKKALPADAMKADYEGRIEPSMGSYVSKEFYRVETKGGFVRVNYVARFTKAPKVQVSVVFAKGDPKYKVEGLWFKPMPAASTAPEEGTFSFASYDGFELDTKIDLPAGMGEKDVRRVVILIHGSGPQDMNEDLTGITKDRAKNLFFKDVSSALTKAGFAVIRYNKRSFQSNLQRMKDPDFESNELYRAFSGNWLKSFVDDAAAYVSFAQERFHGADVYLLGHSQGAAIALQVAHRMDQVKGVALIGFSAALSETIVWEQYVYRPLSYFRQLDADSDEKLGKKELSGKDRISAALRDQLSMVDLDADGSISLAEYKAGNLTNLLVQDIWGKAWREQEAKYPLMGEILKNSRFKVAFFQGLWDNQTPAYNAQAVQMAARTIWKKGNMMFRFYPGLGHALDPRDSYMDIVYRTADPAALKDMAQSLDSFFQ